MNALYRYSILLLVIWVGNLSTHASPIDPRWGIIHGQKTVPAEKFKKNPQKYQQQRRVLTPPWMVSLQEGQFYYLFGKRYSHFCGGTLIAPQWVLTAAHCLAPREPSKTRIKVGASHLYDTEEHLKVSIFRPHPGYDYYGTIGHHDIALIKLHKPILDAQCVKLPDTVDALNNIKHYSQMDAYGYGSTRYYRVSISSRLRHVLLPFNRDWEDEPSETFRAGGDGYHDTAKGDSGGPLMYNGVQYGITSWGYDALEKGLYGSYTNVGYYLSWIQKVLNEENTFE